jgi:hypothetical protein
VAAFTTYAEILTSDHPQWKAYTSGIKKMPPGLPLKDLLEQNGGVYALTIKLTDAFRRQVRKVAELTSDEALLDVANSTEVTISLDHFRHVDPAKTRIVCGYRLDYTKEESARLGLGHKGPYDPRNTMFNE